MKFVKNEIFYEKPFAKIQGNISTNNIDISY